MQVTVSPLRAALVNIFIYDSNEGDDKPKFTVIAKMQNDLNGMKFNKDLCNALYLTFNKSTAQTHSDSWLGSSSCKKKQLGFY